MKREQVIELMAEAGLKRPARGEFIFIHWDQLAQLVEYEREECAKVCETLPAVCEEFGALNRAAAGIRARSQA